MALSRRERFRLKSSMADEISENSREWPWDRVNMLLAEFKLGPLEGYNDAPTFGEVIGSLSDAELIEMYAMVKNVELAEVEDQVESADAPGNWKPGYVRVFLSHSARHKQLIGEVSDELAVVGIHGFVAHDTMAYSKPWQAQIEEGLRTMQAFVAIVHNEFKDSVWCAQETGWALGRRVPHYVIRMGVDPAGFIGHDQWPQGASMTAKEIALQISGWIATVPELGETVVEGLFQALEDVHNYYDAGAAAARIASLGDLTPDQFSRLDAIWWKNDQLYTGALPTKELRPFYFAHDREWPPPKPAAPTPVDVDPWHRGGGETPS